MLSEFLRQLFATPGTPVVDQWNFLDDLMGVDDGSQDITAFNSGAHRPQAENRKMRYNAISPNYSNGSNDSWIYSTGSISTAPRVSSTSAIERLLRGFKEPNMAPDLGNFGHTYHSFRAPVGNDSSGISYGLGFKE